MCRSTVGWVKVSVFSASRLSCTANVCVRSQLLSNICVDFPESLPGSPKILCGEQLGNRFTCFVTKSSVAGAAAMPWQFRIMYKNPLKSRGYGKISHRGLITSEQFRDARIFSGLSRDQVASLLGVSLRTVGHWETGKARANYAAYRLLRVYRHGELVDPCWSGFIVRDGKLRTPEGHAFGPGDVRWLSLLVRRASLARELLRERDALRVELALAQEAVSGPAKRGLETSETIAFQGPSEQYQIPQVVFETSLRLLPASNRGVSETERKAGEAVRREFRPLMPCSVRASAVEFGGAL